MGEKNINSVLQLLHEGLDIPQLFKPQVGQVFLESKHFQFYLSTSDTQQILPMSVREFCHVTIIII